MANPDAILFIDANMYLDLYRTTKGKKLLGSISEQQQYIFITKQVVNEVQRKKLGVAAQFIGLQFDKLTLRSFEIPDHLLDISLEPAKLRQSIADIRSKIEEINVTLKTAALETVGRISRSEDEVSKGLAELFARAAPHTTEELHKARARKELGNPPGKQNDPLGDQLTWEQLLNHAKGKSMVWIVSKDQDYFSRQGEALFLNAFLSHDFAAGIEHPPQIFCFDSIDDGIRDFVKKTGVPADALPTPEESMVIKEELDASLSGGWISNVSANDAAASVMRHHAEAQRRAAHTLMTNQGGWNPGMQ